MSTTPTPTPGSPTPQNNRKKLWITLIVIAALAIIGIIIWRMIAVPD